MGAKQSFLFLRLLKTHMIFYHSIDTYIKSIPYASDISAE